MATRVEHRQHPRSGSISRAPAASATGCYHAARVPTILRKDGFRFFFFSNEGFEPAHIHIEAGEGYAKFWLEPVELAESFRLKSQELRRARLLVDEHKELLLEKWREYFGS